MMQKIIKNVKLKMYNSAFRITELGNEREEQAMIRSAVVISIAFTTAVSIALFRTI
jgi:hypothetical protein